MRLSTDTSDAIRLVSLWCSVLVCMNHTFTLDVAYPAVAGQPLAFATFFIEDAVKHGFARMSTPFFFMVSAYMLFAGLVRRENGGPRAVPLAEGYRGELAKRMRSLAVPFLLWSGWSFLLLAALQQIPQLRAMFSAPLLAQPLAFIVEKLLWNPIAHPLWFVRDLFLLALAWPLAWVLLRQRWVGLAVIAALTVPWFLWWEVRETRAVLFFAIGAWLAIHRPELPRPAAWGVVACGALWLTGAALHALHIMEAGETDPVYNNVTILAELATVWFTTLMFLPWLRRAWLMRATGYTFFIYVAHEPIATFARKAALRVFADQPALLLPAWIVASVATFAICLGAAVALQRWAPAVYGMFTGGRGRRRSTTARAGASLPSPQVA